jgi:hypothetical protein
VALNSIAEEIRQWSREFLEVPSSMLNGLPPCPYAKKAWLENKVTFSVNTGLDGLIQQIKQYDTHDFDIVIWADGFCDGINEALSVTGTDLHLMLFHPDYSPSEAGLHFLEEVECLEDSELDYAMVFVQRLSILDDAALSLEKSGYYTNFPEDTYNSLVVERRRLRDART